MAKDFFQDILPKDDSRPPKRERIQGDEVEVPSDVLAEPAAPPPERSIRNINVNRPRPTPERPALTWDKREVPSVGSGVPKARKSRSTWWLWGAAAALLIVLGTLFLFVFRSTTVTVTPRAQTIVFDSTKTITAYPSSAAPAGALTYSMLNFDVEESQAVASTGSSHVERKASGNVTVVNEYSTSPVKLVKNTRFETPNGLIFRAPADISIPGMKNGAPGVLNITIVADQAGANYNIGPTPRFTLPGLKGGAMFDKVYARSTGTFTGGFSGEEPAVSSDIKNTALAQMRARLEEKVLAQLSGQTDSTVFPSFSVVSYEETPPTPATQNGQVNLNMRARVQVPALPSTELNRQIASAVSADAENARITLIPQTGFGATLSNATSTVYGSTAIAFTLTGTAQLVWDVDTNALATALAGKSESAFQTVVQDFPGVEEARARIQPFWQKSFPSDTAKIRIVVLEAKEGANP